MRKKSFSIEELKEKSDKRRIIFFGAGNHLNSILNNPKNDELGFFSSISYIVDNNSRLWGTSIKCGDSVLNVKSPRILYEEFDYYVIITTCNYVNEISKQLELVANSNMFGIWEELYDYYCEDKSLPRVFEKNSIKPKIIPRIIHYCWFGENCLGTRESKCIKSWKEKCPDYEIVCWNEKNFDIGINRYVSEAYHNKKYAFVSDFFRLWVLYNYGGIYMDTDVELLKNLDCFLSHRFFSGFEKRNLIPTGIMGGIKQSKYAEYLLEYYEDRAFVVNNVFDTTTNVKTITWMTEKKYNISLNNGYLDWGDAVMYPQEVFCPIIYGTGQKNITRNTYAIHWFSGSWLSKSENE